MELGAATTVDAEEIMRVINAAYVVETGDSGYGFKAGVRMTEPLDDYFRQAYEEQRMVKVVSKDLQEIVGVTYWRITDQDTIYFGPFAVRPDMQGKGIGKLMLDEIERIGREKQLRGIEIKVVNWRTDLIPWYEKMGYEHVGTASWPADSKDLILRDPTFFHCMVRPLNVEETKTCTGGCMCGAVRYTLSGPPTEIYYCHCSMCRHVSGSVVGAWLTVPIGKLSIKGELCTYQSSVKFQRQFCGNCGTHVLFRGVDPAIKFIEICHGTLDNPLQYPPVNYIWTGSKLEYVKLNEDLPSFDTEPSITDDGLSIPSGGL